MKKSLSIILTAFLALALTACASTKKAEETPAEPVVVNWADAPSLREAYAPYFDYIGMAVPFNLLSNINVQDGLSHQASCITAENEFKPDFLLGWNKPSSTVDFVAEDGKTYKVPADLGGKSNINQILAIAYNNNLSVRGHVLVWHSQTQNWFFRENYDIKKNLVDKATMKARQEWYIKTVLSYIKEWEDKYAEGKRIVVTWDVANEVISDGGEYLRPSNSHWWTIYQDDSFVVDAFRFANKYAPKDVKLAYNDYGTYNPQKTQKICKLVKNIQADKNARIDVIGMQSHISMTYPGTTLFEKTVKTFLSLGVDVQITEIEIVAGNTLCTDDMLKAKYNDYFNLFLKNRKKNGNNGICGVTIWGTIDERSWVYKNSDSFNANQHPLLFKGNFECKPAFYGVLEAAENWSE